MLTRIDSPMMKNNFTLVKFDETIPAFQLQKSSAQRTASATSLGTDLSSFTNSSAVDHEYVFPDGDIVENPYWIYGNVLETSQTITVNLGDYTYKFPAGTAVELDSDGTNAISCVAATTDAVVISDIGDYAIYLKIDNGAGKLVYSNEFSKEHVNDPTSNAISVSPYSRISTTYRMVGGFHFSPYTPAYDKYGVGGAQITTINPFSVWDLNFRPSCPDPRGMACVFNMTSGLATAENKRLWVDIYMMSRTVALGEPTSQFYDNNGGNNPAVGNRGGISIAHPVIPSRLLSDMTSPGWYSSSTQFQGYDATTCALAYNKKLLTVEEFEMMGFGAKDNNMDTLNIGGTYETNSDTTYNRLSEHYTQPSKIGYHFTSKYGVIGVGGVLYQWGDNGSVPNSDNLVLLGGRWDISGTGSRLVAFNDARSFSSRAVGARLASY